MASQAAFPVVLDAVYSESVFCERLWDMTVVCWKLSCIVCKVVVTFSSNTCSQMGGVVVEESSHPFQATFQLCFQRAAPATGRDWRSWGCSWSLEKGRREPHRASRLDGQSADPPHHAEHWDLRPRPPAARSARHTHRHILRVALCCVGTLDPTTAHRDQRVDFDGLHVSQISRTIWPSLNGVCHRVRANRANLVDRACLFPGKSLVLRTCFYRPPPYGLHDDILEDKNGHLALRVDLRQRKSARWAESVSKEAKLRAPVLVSSSVFFMRRMFSSVCGADGGALLV